MLILMLSGVEKGKEKGRFYASCSFSFRRVSILILNKNRKIELPSRGCSRNRGLYLVCITVSLEIFFQMILHPNQN